MPKLTFGQRAVGLTFNPSGDQQVHEIKQRFADLIDEMDVIRGKSGHNERARLASITITELQTAQMWVIKTLTWRYSEAQPSTPDIDEIRSIGEYDIDRDGPVPFSP